MLEPFAGNAAYLWIAGFLILTGCGLPIPEEVPILTAGILSASGDLDPWLALAACLVGAVLGDCVMYGIGHHWGHNLVKTHPWFARLLHADQEEKFEALVRRHGLKVLFVARFMVGVRSPVYLSAGVLRIGFVRFLLMDLFCATVVVGTFFWIAYTFGRPIIDAIRRGEVLLTILVALAIAAAGGWYYLRQKKRFARWVEVQNIRAERTRDREQRHAERQQQLTHPTS